MTAATARRGLMAGLTAPILAIAVALLAATAHAGEAVEMPAASDAPVMLGARIVGDDSRVRFVADLSKTVAATVFTLADPDRIVVDLPEVHFALPQLAGATGRGLITAFRYGLISPGKSRIVIDLSGPTLIDKTFVVDPADGQPARLVIDAVPTDRGKFLDATRAYKQQQLASTANGADAGVSAAPDDHGDKPIVVVDSGHGGIDTGAHGGGGVLEKDVTLGFGKTLGKLLEASGRYRVVYTRDDDSYISLGDRVAIARRNNADLFVSIHANSFPGGSVRGAIVYTASDKASDKMAAALANTENESDALAGVDVNAADSNDVMSILNDLTLRETRNFGVVFARNLVKELGKSTRLFKVPHQEASFKVLEAPDVPSALIELGYLTNPNDAKLMVTQAWQDKTAESIVKAIDDYFSTRVAGRGGN
jgi:N-acetylmuramoyl-L-alanine amidase